jgi:ribA/ribD-fused uncharacterized protein
MRYHLSWLTDKFDNGESLEYIFFSGHSAAASKTSKLVGEFILSQWFPSTFTVNHVVYKTAGHWMMARKAFLFRDMESYNKILNADRIEEAQTFGRNIKGFDELKWMEWRYEIVREGNFHKFNQGKKLRAYLLNTGNAIIAEANPADEIWGIGLKSDSRLAKNPYTWNGQNLLGFALMEVRDYFRNYSKLAAVIEGTSGAAHNKNPEPIIS